MTADTGLLFCTAQNLFGNGTVVLSTDWIDMRVAQDNAGGRDITIEALVTTTFTGGTGGTLEVVACDAAGANGVQVAVSDFLAVAALTAPTGGGAVPVMGGSIILLRLSPLRVIPGSTLTHLRAQFRNAGNNTAGAMTIHMRPAPSSALPAKAWPPVPY
jgi:hypothetical protein